MVEKGFNQTWVGALRLQFYSTQLVSVDGQHAMTAKADGQHAMTAKSTTQLKRPIDDSRSHSQCLTAELMSYYADSVTLFIRAATPPAGATPAAGARAIWFFFPRGQPCLVCWLVSPPKWERGPFPVAVPTPGPALGCFCACALGRHAPR